MLLVVFLLACPGWAALNRWSSGGPFGGTVEELAFDPGAPGVVYAGTFGGVYRSEDHGATWTAASFGLLGADITGLEVVPGSPGVLYTATDAGVQKSGDGGRNWQLPVLDERIDALALAPSNPQILYAAVRRAIHKSTDGGASWSPVHTLTGTDDINYLEVDPQEPSSVYAGTSDTIYRSQDGGSTFTPLPAIGPRYVQALAIDPANPQVLYAGTSEGVFKSADRGLTWTPSGLADQFLQEVVVDPAAPATLLALGYEVFRSTNAGASWTSVLDDPLALAAAFDPASASNHLLGTTEGIYRSTDQGASWHLSDTGLTASVVSRLAVDPHRPGSLYASSVDGTLFKTADGGATWSRINGVSDVRAFALDPKTASLLYAATLQGLVRSQDGGSTWVLINSVETGIGQLAVDPQTPSTLYLSRSPDGIRKSVDGGLTWSPAGPDVADFRPHILVIAPSAPQTLFAGDFDTGLFKSTDGGATWSAIDDGLPDFVLNALAVDPHDAGVLYAAVENESLYKSTDGGATWSFSGSGIASPNVAGIAVDPSEPSRLYAASLTSGIFRSTNAGATWSRFDDGRLTGLWMEAIALDPVNPFLLYAASAGGGVLSRADLQPGNSLELNGDRFLVRMSWVTGAGATGPGHAQALTGDTGYAWFFQESNVEVLLKVLDGCGLNGRFWVFAAGLTNVRTDITVADTQTRAVRIYHNPLGQPFQPIQDTSALACGDAAASVAGKSAATSEPLLLRDGRFRVTAEFATSPGAPQPMPGALLTDDAAYLWFFDPNNVEVFLKVVDGCPVNGRFWVFAAGLTDVEVRITVEDTQTGESQVYENPAGTAFLPIQDTSAFAGCS